jgi:hypothetical protein
MGISRPWRSVTVLFEGFPRVLERTALRPGRWFVAADGLRPVLCFATDVAEGGDPVTLTFGAPRVETVEVGTIGLSALSGPFATVEDTVVFAPGLLDGSPTLIAPARRTFRSGSLLRLRSGELGIGFVTGLKGELAVVSLNSGQRADGFELVFERWSLSLRRGAVETLIGHFKPIHSIGDRRWL